MVLQREARVPIWGWAAPESPVTVTFAGQKKKVVVNSNGRWEVFLDPIPAGGPFTLKVEGEGRIVVRDVLVGDVYLCSGQSNMEMKVSGCRDAEKEIAAAQYPEIRQYGVPLIASQTPQEIIGGEWKVCSPKTAGGFSGTAYYFARYLHRELGVPIGLVVSAFGGTVVETWVSEEAYLSEPRMRPLLEKSKIALKNAAKDLKQHVQAVIDWQKTVGMEDPGNKGYEKGWADLEHPLTGWKTMRLPAYWEQHGLAIDGAVWFRKEVNIPKEWKGKNLTLHLGMVDDFDTTYFNGEKVGATGRERLNAYTVRRSYTIPARLVRTGRNVIAVRVYDHYGNGGMPGPQNEMRLERAGDKYGAVIPLAGDWQYQVELAIPPKKGFPSPPTQAFSPEHQNLPCNLYRGMIAPLIPYAFRGVIWYQGEANSRVGNGNGPGVGNPEDYKILFPLMIQDWRRRWGQDLPFFFVQLACCEVPQFWPVLREAQLAALNLPATGVALAIDIGDAKDIHAKNKQDVGLRLALQALKTVYGKKVISSGPKALASVREGKQVRVSFEGTEGGLRTTNGKTVTGFFLIQGKKQVPARAKIERRDVILSAPGITKPTAVSYGWENVPVINLTNDSGLPTRPFHHLL